MPDLLLAQRITGVPEGLQGAVEGCRAEASPGLPAQVLDGITITRQRLDALNLVEARRELRSVSSQLALLLPDGSIRSQYGDAVGREVKARLAAAIGAVDEVLEILTEGVRHDR